MVAARTAARGLTPADLDGIRESLAAGRRPKVQFTESAGQVAGQLGQVVKLADPAAGEDFVVVRFGRDELPFSPADLKVPPRATKRGSDQTGAKEESAKGRAESPARKRTAAANGAAAAPGPPLRLTEPPSAKPAAAARAGTPNGAAPTVAASQGAASQGAAPRGAAPNGVSPTGGAAA